MPSIRDAGTLQSAKMFCEDFLNAGGLNMVVNVMHKDAIPSDVDYETRQGCYAMALQLLRYTYRLDYLWIIRPSVNESIPKKWNANLLSNG